MSEDVCGWAVYSFDECDVRTVSPTRRAAQVNALVVIFGQRITAATDDLEIERLWRHFAQQDHVVARVVVVRAYEPARARSGTEGTTPPAPLALSRSEQSEPAPKEPGR
jgi:hypothetical protein